MPLTYVVGENTFATRNVLETNLIKLQSEQEEENGAQKYLNETGATMIIPIM